jgi:hypothetical protein
MKSLKRTSKVSLKYKNKKKDVSTCDERLEGFGFATGLFPFCGIVASG